jgi:zinc D-Ala-D-Ala carboxypeptidase
LSNPGLPRNATDLTPAFDDIPEAQRETVEAPPARSWLPLIGIGLGLLALGVVSLAIGRLNRPTPIASQPNQSSPVSPSTNPESSPTLDADGRMLNHYPYPEAAAADLEPITADGSFKLHASAAKAYKEMAAAAQADGVILVPLSAFRSVQDQQELFFQISRDRNQRPEERAAVSAPPGHSEHHTGYAIDLGDGNVPAVNLSPNFENTKAYQWLQANAARFSFELSFPKDNAQGVSYEPWHWRFVGDSDSLETFYKAKNSPESNPPNP